MRILEVIDEGEGFVERLFSEYYCEGVEDIPLPYSFKKREFGFIPFHDHIMIRHRGFKTPREFKAFINRLTPRHAYYSSAYYKDPKESMDKKGWMGADLIFDIDSDHIKSPCGEEHRYWVCNDCKKTTVRASGGMCPRCGSHRLSEEFWLCETCLEMAKTETLKLISFIMNDFGFKREEVEACFSGHRGYHLHVHGEGVKTLDQAARREIVDYIMGVGLSVRFHGVVKANGRGERGVWGPSLSDPGWRGRIARGAYDFLTSSTLSLLEEVEGLSKASARIVASNREKILSTWDKRSPWGTVNGVGPKTWQALAKVGAKMMAPQIDPVVTTDIHRLIRVPNTLHGKTGLKVMKLPLNSLENFNPLVDPIAFPEGSLKLLVEECPHFSLGGHVFGPYRDEKIEVPTAVGLYLLCKKTAKVIN